MRRFYVAFAVTVGLACAPAAASADLRSSTVSVSGTVATPASYSRSQLASLPQTTFSVTARTWWGGVRTEVDQGVSLETLVNTSSPRLPNVKNALLRVIVTVRGLFGIQRTFALGELDASFGNHPAYLVLTEDGAAIFRPELVVPGDVNGVRGVPDVSQIGVAVESPAAVPPPAVGMLSVQDGAATTALTAAQLASLPQQTLTVSFGGPSGVQTHTETGPTLDDVLRAAHIWPELNTWVAGVGSDGYVATVTPAEAWVGGRPLLISLVEDGHTFISQGEGPRLVADGDVKGGRYDSGLDNLVVGDTQSWPW